MRKSVDWLESCAGFLRIHSPANARQAAENAILEQPEDGRLWESLGIAAWLEGDEPAARSALETATTLVPLSVMGQLALADCYLAAGVGELAEVIYDHALRLTGCSIELLRKLAASLGSRREWNLALKACRILAERSPDCPHAQFGIAYYLSRLGAPATEIEPHLRRAHRIVPHCWLARLNLASVLATQEQFEEAHQLVSIVDVRWVIQPYWLDRIAVIAKAVGDDRLSQACAAQLERLGSGAATAKRRSEED